jgi:hypothetical protein
MSRPLNRIGLEQGEKEVAGARLMRFTAVAADCGERPESLVKGEYRDEKGHGRRMALAWSARGRPRDGCS